MAFVIAELIERKPRLVLVNGDANTNLAGALAATFIEIIPWPLNDNFWMPLISASVLSLLSRLITQ